MPASRGAKDAWIIAILFFDEGIDGAIHGYGIEKPRITINGVSFNKHVAFIIKINELILSMINPLERILLKGFQSKLRIIDDVQDQHLLLLGRWLLLRAGIELSLVGDHGIDNRLGLATAIVELACANPDAE